MASKKAIWISYDFGIKGDYTGLFTWLDNHKAVECGAGLAFVRFENTTITDDGKALIEIISNDIKEYVKLSKSDRLYLIWKDDQTGRVKGEFINGSRKQSPWEGYGKIKTDNFTDTDE
ncbi:MAG: hypothetical protein NTW29_06285 [Bacteroidetes bacterium]|nr:hypothetical protein [Bacteroidota bacterium]